MLLGMLRDEDGVTATEYAMMLVLIIVAAITAISSVGGTSAGGWSNNVSKIQSAASFAGS
jgi:Flp pilus assembly pilin Flp